MTASSLSVVRKMGTSALVAQVDAQLNGAILEPRIDTSQGFYALEGMSGKRYRYFINRLVRRVDNARYFEIGSWAGSTLCAAVHGNTVEAVAIDNWSEYGGPKDIFLHNIRTFVTPGANVYFIESDFRKVDYSRFETTFNIYLFDGPHQAQDHYDGLAMVLPCLDNEFVFIVDDWNWERVRQGTLAAISKCAVNVLYAAEVRSSINNGQPRIIGKDSDWHNGYFISVLAKH